MRKFCKILNIFLVVIVLLAVSGGVANAQRVKFEKVDLKQGLSVNPVRLNKNEIFIPGGWGENLKDVLLTAKIYKIKEKKLNVDKCNINVREIKNYIKGKSRKWVWQHRA